MADDDLRVLVPYLYAHVVEILGHWMSPLNTSSGWPRGPALLWDSDDYYCCCCSGAVGHWGIGIGRLCLFTLC